MDIYAVANQMRMERKTIFDLPMRVTYYGRVSTTREEQENSIEHQMSYFSEMIQNLGPKLNCSDNRRGIIFLKLMLL